MTPTYLLVDVKRLLRYMDEHRDAVRRHAEQPSDRTAGHVVRARVAGLELLHAAGQHLPVPVRHTLHTYLALLSLLSRVTSGAGTGTDVVDLTDAPDAERHVRTRVA